MCKLASRCRCISNADRFQWSRTVAIGARCCRIDASDGETRSLHNLKSQTMTTTTRKTTTTRASKVRTVKVAPEALADVDVAAPTLALPAHLAAALQTAQQAQQRQTRKAPTPRVSLTPAELATLERMGWTAPTVDASYSAAPQPRTRTNRCKGGAAYDAAAAILTAGQSLKLTELAALWLAAGGDAKPFNAILQQVANRAGRTIQQNGATIAAV